MRDEAACEHGTRMLKLSALLVVSVLLLYPTIAFAQYVVGPSVIAGGGARLTGGGYVITGTTGQSAPIGASGGGSYMTHHGFWHAVTGGGGALSPMVLDIELISATTARISWPVVSDATHYDLYRSPTPYFHASGAPWQIVTHPTAHRDFTGGIGNSSTNYFFLGKARNATQESVESNIVGEFDYGADIPLVGFDLSMRGSEAER